MINLQNIYCKALPDHAILCPASSTSNTRINNSMQQGQQKRCKSVFVAKNSITYMSYGYDNASKRVLTFIPGFFPLCTSNKIRFWLIWITCQRTVGVLSTYCFVCVELDFIHMDGVFSHGTPVERTTFIETYEESSRRSELDLCR